MRLFVAMAPPRQPVDELDDVVAPLRAAWPGLRWTGTDAWHVTLAFLGEVPDRIVPALCTGLERAARRHHAVTLSFGGAGAFPGARRARVLCTGIRTGHAAESREDEALKELAGSVADGARQAGALPADERRRYRPHLTLARCGEPVDVSPLVETLAGFAGSAWTAAQIHLISSRPGGEPRYTVLGSWPLCSAPGSSLARQPASARKGSARTKTSAGGAPAGGAPDGGAPHGGVPDGGAAGATAPGAGS
jgi:2'-5' RNA ligase